MWPGGPPGAGVEGLGVQHGVGGGEFWGFYDRADQVDSLIASLNPQVPLPSSMCVVLCCVVCVGGWRVEGGGVVLGSRDGDGRAARMYGHWLKNSRGSDSILHANLRGSGKATCTTNFRSAT